jgi:hypothetical protein
MPALEAPVQHRRGEVDFLEFPTPPGELDDPRCAGSGARTPGCRRLLGASGQPGAACAPLGKQMLALEAPVQHRRGEVDFLEFPTPPGELDDPRCAGSGARTPGCRRLLGASGQPGAACAPLGKQMLALEAPVQHRRGEVDFLEFSTPPGELDDPRCAGSGGGTPGCRRLLGASGQPGAACAPLGKQMPALEAPVQHRRGEVDFLEFPTPPGELDDPRCAGSGARTPGCRRLLGASGQPGAACAPLGKQMLALEAPVQHRRGEVDFLEFPTPPGELDDPRCAGSGGGTPGCRRLLGASGQPGAACAPLGKQMPALEAPVQHRRGEVDFLEFPTPPGELDDPRCAGSGARTPGCRRLLGASGQPGAACAPLGKQMLALEAPVQHRRGEVDFLEFPTPPGELDDPRCAGSGARTPGCRRLLGASGQPGAACAPLGKQMPALEAPVQHRRGEVDFLEFPTPPGELDDPRCAGSGGGTPGCRRLLGASGQPGAACAPLGKQMPALEAPVQHRRGGEVDFLEFPTPPGELDDPRCAGSGGGTPGCRRLLGASGQPGAACAPLGKQMLALEAPVQHRRGEVDFLEFPTPPGELDDPRCAGSGARTPGCRRLLGASGQPGAACAPLGKQMLALEAPVQHRRGEVDFFEFASPPGELDDPRCAGSGARTPGCRRLLGASGQPGAACAPLGKQMPALEAPVQHRRGEVDFLEFPTPPGELDDPRCAGSGARTPGCRRLLGASGQPGAACAPLGKQMPALEAPVQHRRGGEIDFLEFPTPPGELDDPRCAGSGGGLQGAGACSGPRGSPGQHARLWASRCWLLKRRSSIVGGRSIFSNFQQPPENSMIRGAQAAERGLQGAGACSGPRGSPGQHARLWASRCWLLKRRSSIVGGRSIFSNLHHPPENSMIRGAQAAERGLQGAGACSGPRGSPGQHARLWVSRCRLLKRRSSIVGGRSIFSNFRNPPESSMIRGAQAAERGLQGAGACSGPRGSPGQHARLWASRCRLLKRRSSIVGGRSIFLNFQHPPENSMIRGAQVAERGLQGAGACSGPRGSPGQHARLWASRCRLLKRRSSIVGGRSIFLNFQQQMSAAKRWRERKGLSGV